ncbi:hypothetical protein [Streptosporangium sp. G12]
MIEMVAVLAACSFSGLVGVAVGAGLVRILSRTALSCCERVCRSCSMDQELKDLLNAERRQ